jgi:polyisoprenyl-teichoic acid--peptidoglycan teichoic acid transferase
MENFRKRNRYDQRQAIDSILNAPTRPIKSDRPVGRHRFRMEGFKSTNRPLDDFRRPEGYHVAQSNSVRTDAESAAAPSRRRNSKNADQASLLHMTLPSGGGLSRKERRRAKKHEKAIKHGRWHTIRKWTLRSALTLTVLAVLCGGFLFTKGYFKLHKVFKGGGTAAALQANVKPELLKGEGDGRINVLLLGKGGGNHDGPDLTDTILIASIDPVNKVAQLVSIPRDLWVTVPGYGSTKINAVYANAKYRSLANYPKDKQRAENQGIKAIEDTVTDVLGIPLHYYGMVDFHAFQQAVDTVGGVDMNVPPELAVTDHMFNEDTGKPYYLNVPAGQQHFDGIKALMFTRTRHTSPRGDFDRTERQRLFISSLSEKVLSAGTYTNPVKISQLMSAFGDHVATDLSISNGLRLAQIGKGIPGNNIKSVGLADPPNNFLRTDNLNGLSIVRPSAGIGDYSEIRNFIRNTLKDPYIAKENAAIQVLNGTVTPGLATSKSDMLKSYGYNVVKIGDAPTSAYDQTVIVDMTNGKKPFTQHYLEQRFGVKAVRKLPDSTIQATGSDFVIILGQDASSNSQN